jgi:hypothetical protein
MISEARFINIDVGSMCRTDELGNNFMLPSTKELEDAIMVINKYCSDKAYKIQLHMQEEFEANVYGELKQAQEINDLTAIKVALRKLTNYKGKD